jgi:transcriptional regulator with XRE-family HTH domain
MGIKHTKRIKKDIINSEIRKKLGITQSELASVFNVSSAYLSMVEAGKRNLHSDAGAFLAKIFLQLYELETGKQSSERSLETRLFLNEEYRKILPKMKTLEQNCRFKVKMLKKDMENMKERARDAEHAIIVFTTAIKNLKENDKPANKEDRQLAWLDYLKQKAYDNLLTCWEPEQAKLHGKIDAIAGEARSLRRYRVKVMREHDPFKKGAN